VINFMNVDLPAPFGPSRPVTPVGTVTLTSLSPITWPYHLERWSAEMTGDVLAVLDALGVLGVVKVSGVLEVLT
jgi:hypothetical protein